MILEAFTPFLPANSAKITTISIVVTINETPVPPAAFRIRPLPAIPPLLLRFPVVIFLRGIPWFFPSSSLCLRILENFEEENSNERKKTLAQYFFPFLRGTTFAAWTACLRRKLPGTLHAGGMIRFGTTFRSRSKTKLQFSSPLFSFYSKVIDPFFRCRNFRELFPGFAAATSPVANLTACSLTPCSVLIREKE